MGFSKEEGEQFLEKVKVNAALSALRKKGFNATANQPEVIGMGALVTPESQVFSYRPVNESIFRDHQPFKERKRFTVKWAPMGAPRMTRRDKWKSRPVVERYFAYRDAIRAAVGDVPVIPDRMECVFCIPMPPSWSKKKHLEMAGKPHRQRPDRDNCEKAIMDSLFLEDGGVWSGEQQKYWCVPGEERVEITMIWL